MMLKRMAFILTASIGLAAAQPAYASKVSDMVASYASSMQELVGQEYDGGLKVTGVRADGEVLVIEVDGPAGWRTELDPTMIADAFASGFCQSGGEFFQTGMKIRVDTTETAGKNPFVGTPITHCPAK